MQCATGMISVIMSNYNTPEEYLRMSIDSVLRQSYENFEFIIVDDCSTDESLRVIESYKDARITILKNSENMGITKSLNRALGIAKGEFVARMDADDECMPLRFEKQVEYLKKNPSVVVCGTWVEIFGEGAYQYKEKYSCKTIPKKEEFQINLLFGNHINIIHPTAMFRRDILLKYNITYNEQYLYAQDYRMWVDCSRIGECANVPEVLLRYRVHSKAVSSDKKNTQFDCTKRIISEQLGWIDLGLPEDWEVVHYGLLVGRKEYGIQYKRWMKRLIMQNRVHKIYDQELLEKILWDKWAEISYFELYKGTVLQKLKVFFNLPVVCYGKLLKIRKKRNMKKV